ncbi:MAG: TonB-dependent receptor plug domain-containing protein, partial [Nitrospirae bacterium]|nr:TonB-dependent receptor plug domain-containing protein [Nitrospirota bacterium]
MYRLRSLFGVLVMVGFILWVGAAGAQDPAPVPPPSSDKVQRKQQLEQRLKEILEELDSLKELGEASKEPTPSVVKEQKVAEQPGGDAEVELKDMSIISRRVQKRPEGISFSATPRSETDSQPTRHMREALESLPGVVVRQANGPRDFSISIRGSGVKTTFAIRDLKMYEDGIIQTQSDGLTRIDLHYPWFMKSVEVTRGASSSLYDNYALGGMVQFKTR